jgi:hypothetical protein
LVDGRRLRIFAIVYDVTREDLGLVVHDNAIDGAVAFEGRSVRSRAGEGDVRVVRLTLALQTSWF